MNTITALQLAGLIIDQYEKAQNRAEYKKEADRKLKELLDLVWETAYKMGYGEGQEDASKGINKLN